MKRFFILLLLSASVGWAEEAKLPHNTVMRSGSELLTLKAGTVVKIVEQGDKTVTIKAGGKVGTIPWSALDDAEIMKPAPRTNTPAPTTSHKLTSSSNPVAAASAPPAASAVAPRPAQSMYGKMVEKARTNAASHEKALVQPTDEVLDGK